MDKHDKRGGRYSAEEEAVAFRMVRTLRVELGPSPCGRGWPRPTLMKANVKGSLRILLLKFVDLNRNCGK